MAHAKATSTYTPAWARNDPTRRFIVVRNVQYRSDSGGRAHIAMGSAGVPYAGEESGRTTFTDSIVLNHSLGYNADTGKAMYVDITNSLGLNVWWWANLNATTFGWNDGYNLSGNSIRFGPRVAYPTFRMFCWESWANGSKAYTNPDLIIGRGETNDLFTVVRMGSVNNLTVSDNQITTIPAARFDTTGAIVSNPKYRLLLKAPILTAASCEWYPTQYYPGVNLVVGQNFASEFAQDFGWLAAKQPIPTPGTYSSVTETAPASVQAERPLLGDMDLGQDYYNFGRIARVHPVTTPLNRTYSWKNSAGIATDVVFTDQSLVGAWEVSMADPTIGPSTVTLPVRIVLQHTPPVATEFGADKRVWLKVTGLVTWNGDLVCDALGAAAFQISLGAGLHGELNVTTFHDPLAANGPAGQFSEYKVAYATGTIPIGTVVSVVPLIPVAVDRREGGVQEGRIRFQRTGSLASSLTVAFSLAENSNLRPATLGSDFTLIVSGVGSITASGSSGTVTFPASVSTVEVRVVPITDQVIEREHVWVTLQGGANYAVSGSRTKASVYLYDGPPWTLHEITHDAEPFNGVTRAKAVSGHLSGSTPAPVVAADIWTRRTGPNGPNGYTITSEGYVGAQWSGTFGVPSFVFEGSFAPPHAPVATGINDLEQHTLSGYLTLPSGFDRAARMWLGAVPGYNASWSYLPVPTGGEWLADKNRALCISPNGTYLGGYATRLQSSPAVQEQMGVMWKWSGMTALFSEPALDGGRIGEALAVNNAGEFVGRRNLANSVGQYIPRAFRSRSDGTTVLAGDLLNPPAQSPPLAIPSDVPSIALAVSERSGVMSGVAVGWAGRQQDNAWLSQPVIWWSRTNDLPQPNNNAWVPLSGFDTGQVNAIGSGRALYGWVGTASGANRKAWRWVNGWTAGSALDDKFLVFGFTSSWTLQEIVDASDKEVLLGNGTKAGSARAFLLIPQAVAN